VKSLFIDYRHFDAANIAPRFEFGFGLSYTQFKYDKLSTSLNVVDKTDVDSPVWANWTAGTPVSQSSTQPWLHRIAVNVTFTVQNVGGVAGTEIPQLYLHYPPNSGEPPSVLRGFNDVDLQPGETKTVLITLSRFDLSTWDVPNQAWMRVKGTYSVSVGASSRDFRLKGTIPL